jgi:hypothetical protein
LLRELLGVDAEDRRRVSVLDGLLGNVVQTLDFLSGERQNRALDIEERFSARQARLMSSGGDPDEAAQLRQKVEKEKLAEMAKVLSPEELQEYKFRTSSLAASMRSDLRYFQPTEQEFRSLYNVLEKYGGDPRAISVISVEPPKPGGDLPGGKAGEDPKLAEALKKAAAEAAAEAEKGAKRDKELRETLGEQRYEEYKRSQDGDYQNIVRITDKNQLPREHALRAYEISRAAEDQRIKVNANTAYTEEQKSRAIEAIEGETSKALKAALGEKVYDAYRKTTATGRTLIDATVILRNGP